MRFVHTADNHLDLPLSSLPPQKAALRHDARLASFSKIIDFTKNNADMLLISGDLFDSPNPPQSVLSFCIKEFEKLGDIPVFISLGNHDYLKADFHFPGNVHVFPDHFESVIFKDCRITGASFTSPKAAFSSHIPSADTEHFNILLLHGDIFTQSEYNSMNKDIISSYGYSYIALGHIHSFSRYKSIVYPGCHDGSGFDETGEKGFIFADSANLSALSFIPSSSLVYSSEQFDISPYCTSAEIADALMEKYPNGIYKFILIGTPSYSFTPNISAIETYISQKFFHAVVIDNTTISSDITSSMLYKLFSEYISSHLEGEAAKLALRYGIDAMKGDNQA